MRVSRSSVSRKLTGSVLYTTLQFRGHLHPPWQPQAGGCRGRDLAAGCPPSRSRPSSVLLLAYQFRTCSLSPHPLISWPAPRRRRRMTCDIYPVPIKRRSGSLTLSLPLLDRSPRRVHDVGVCQPYTWPSSLALATPLSVYSVARCASRGSGLASQLNDVVVARLKGRQTAPTRARSNDWLHTRSSRARRCAGRAGGMVTPGSLRRGSGTGDDSDEGRQAFSVQQVHPLDGTAAVEGSKVYTCI